MFDFDGDGKVDKFDDFMNYEVSGGSRNDHGRRRKRDHSYDGVVNWGWILFCLFFLIAAYSKGGTFSYVLALIVVILLLLWIFVWNR